MLATAVTLSLFAFVLTMVVDVFRRDGRKILSALEGRSLAAEPKPSRPVTVRFSRQRKAVEAMDLRPVLRAAA